MNVDRYEAEYLDKASAELDELVSALLFENRTPAELGVRSLSDSWDGFGLIYSRLREMGFGLSCGGHPSDPPNVQFFNYNYSRFVRVRSRGASGETLPRAAAVAAIIGMRGME